MVSASLLRATKTANEQERDPRRRSDGPGERPVHQCADGPHGGAGNALRDAQKDGKRDDDR